MIGLGDDNMNPYVSGRLAEIKLVIWDLDETFWNGTLDDGDVITIPQDHIELIKRLTDIGIVNSICSKNDREKAESVLRENKILDYFVFRSIDWTNKGQRIKSQIHDMGLRPVNVLFIDDNHLNLEEAEYFCPGIMTNYPDCISVLLQEANESNKKDLEHKRLNQYKVLEIKQEEKRKYDCDTSFLRDSNIKVNIHKQCADEIVRIHELIMRSNQLNFTKNRSSIDELKELLDDPSINAGTVWVSDKFGDYGMVGFYAVKNGRLVHFLFSCRTIGMGIEQYVYNILNRPKLDIIGDVISTLDDTTIPDWINTVSKSEKSLDDTRSAVIGSEHSVLFKGPCDLLRIFNFIDQNNIIDAELTHINPKTGVEIESDNHSFHIVQSFTLSENEKKDVIEELPFSSENFYDTGLLRNVYKTVFISTLHDAHLGVYQRKNTNQKVAFGEAAYPITDSHNFEKYVSGSIYTANCKFSYEFLKWFSENYEFCGRTSSQQLYDNFKYICKRLPKSTKIFLLLGVEHPYEKNSDPAYEGLENVYIENNAVLRKLERECDNLTCISFEDFVKGQSGFYNNINHFTMAVYYELAKKVTSIINQENNDTSTRMASKTKLKMWEIAMQLKKVPAFNAVMAKLRNSKR